MELAFDTRELRSICEESAEAEAAYGPALAEALRGRLADLSAATSVKDLLVGNPRLASDSRTMVVDLSDGHQLRFSANHNKNPVVGDGGIDWEKVDRVKIIAIGAGE